MRFRLVEAPMDGTKPRKATKATLKQWPPPTSVIDKFKSLTKNSDQVEFLEATVIPAFKHMFGLRQMIIECIQYYGLDPKKNKFLDFLANLNVSFPNRDDRPKMDYIYKSWKNDKIDLKMPVLQNPNLYKRTFEDFKYTVNAFNLFSDQKAISNYLKEPTDPRKKPDLQLFMVSKNGNMAKDEIKPAGRRGNGYDPKKPLETIYGCIEFWAKDNEYSPEEIVQRKKDAEAKEKNKTNNTKTTNTTSQTTTININGSDWDYDYFKLEIEKVFANASQFKIPLGKKDQYLNRLYATFVLPNLSGSSNNDVQGQSASDVKPQDVKKFGDPSKIDTPIFVNLVSNNQSTPGAFVFNQFVPLDANSMPYYKTIADKNLGNLKRHLHNISPNDDTNADIHLQKIIDAVGKLQEITHR